MSYGRSHHYHSLSYHRSSVRLVRVRTRFALIHIMYVYEDSSNIHTYHRSKRVQKKSLALSKTINGTVNVIFSCYVLRTDKKANIPRAIGLIMSMLAIAAPRLCPIKVTLLGSPPIASMLS